MQIYTCKKVEGWFEFGVGIRIFKGTKTIRCYIVILILKLCIEIKRKKNERINQINY